MRDSKAWLDYLRTLAGHGMDISVYASQWAHDLRCGRSGAEHRRVGSYEGPRAHQEWLQAGFTAHQPLTRSPVRNR